MCELPQAALTNFKPGWALVARWAGALHNTERAQGPSRKMAETNHEMRPGALGFYRPEPSGMKSPYIIREIIGDKLHVLVIPTQMEFTIERAEWMSIEEMENSTIDMLGPDDNLGTAILILRIRKLTRSLEALHAVASISI